MTLQQLRLFYSRVASFDVNCSLSHNLPYSKLTVAAQSDLNWGSMTALYESLVLAAPWRKERRSSLSCMRWCFIEHKNSLGKAKTSRPTKKLWARAHWPLCLATGGRVFVAEIFIPVGNHYFSSFGEHTAVCCSSVRQAVSRPRHRQSGFVAAFGSEHTSVCSCGSHSVG